MPCGLEGPLGNMGGGSSLCVCVGGGGGCGCWGGMGFSCGQGDWGGGQVVD